MNNYFLDYEEKILKKCQKPGRYIGGELLSTKKNWDETKLKWALFFPDIYDLGISNLGIVTLYRILNSHPDILAERFYMPAYDALEIMEKESICPLSLENKIPLKYFDILGVTLPYELTVTNILKFFQISGLDIIRENNSYPIIIGGGALAYNPLPLSPFFDAFVIGDGEEVLIPISEIVIKNKNNKEKTLEELSKINGVFVPKIHGATNIRVKRLLVNDLNKYEPPLPIVPIVEGTFERLSLEVARGCTRGCRFCFSGMTSRPCRERDVEKIISFMDFALKKTGFDEFSPSSLSITDFSCFNNLFDRLYEYTKKNNVALSLPSLRVGSITEETAKKIADFRKTGFTIAPETSPALQKALNKNIDFDLMAKDIETAFSLGWRNIKLYFMIGLPDETEKDIMQIYNFINYILKTAKNLKPHITLSFSNFIPKPHTPLQWAKMADINELLDKQKILKDLFYPKKSVYLKLHNPYMSIIECIIARGDRETGKIIQEAVNCGAIFDAWDDRFNFRNWITASERSGINLDKYLKEIDINESLPWEFIDIGIDREFLKKEYLNYKNHISTLDCRFSECSGCGVCDFKTIKHVFSEPFQEKIVIKNEEKEELNKGYIIVYEKKGTMKYLGNLDVFKLWHRMLRIAGVKLEYSKGHNPQPNIDGGWAIPLGMTSYCEILKFKGFIENENNFLEYLNKILPVGIVVTDFLEYDNTLPIDSFAHTFEFICYSKPKDNLFDYNSFDNQTVIVIKKDGSKKELPIKEQLKDLKIKEDFFIFTIEMRPGGIKPIDMASKIAGKEVTPFQLEKLRAFCVGGKVFGKRINN
ncbi:MAG: TIGR03960 family B12-binding radical SAM protein [Proteobacteria bacterium]|nr:TIGR03960 family B12-binding radical SAM protein [Pseudomonadota bacterium]